ncbi:MAG: hypothetical protein ABW019_17880 [Chitinophagaceae bacterium]
MARIAPIPETELTPSLKVVFERHMRECSSGITNMKATLGHSLPAFEAYMQWYPLYEEVEKILGKRLASLYAYTISQAVHCSLCAAFFRKLIADRGENPDRPELTPAEQAVLDFGKSIGRYHGNIADHVFNIVSGLYSKTALVALIAFAGQMIATNVFNNVVETDIDEYLVAYRPLAQYH